MKKYLFILALFFFSTHLKANTGIVYIDVQFIIENSDLGKFYKNELDNLKNITKQELKSDESQIKNMENEINNQKNILKKEELNKKILELDKSIKNYKSKRKELSQKFNEKKNTYSSKILNLLNPILTEYAETNNIIFILEKKNILVGIKNLDITDKIIDIINDETKKKNLINESR